MRAFDALDIVGDFKLVLVDAHLVLLVVVALLP
jgi:hypothetical protein